MNDKQVSDPVDGHLGAWETLDNRFTILGFQEVEECAGDLQTFLTGENSRHFLFHQLSEMLQLADVFNSLCFNVVEQDGLHK